MPDTCHSVCSSPRLLDLVVVQFEFVSVLFCTAGEGVGNTDSSLNYFTSFEDGFTDQETQPNGDEKPPSQIYDR